MKRNTSVLVPSPAALRLVETNIITHRPYAFETARRVFGNREDAEDAVCEAIFRALQAAHQYDPKQRFQRWFGHITRMVCYEWIRASKAQKRPQTVCFTSAASSLGQRAGGSDGESTDWLFDVADTNVDVAGQAIASVLGIADSLPDWLIEALLTLSDSHRSLLLDVYVLQVPRAQVLAERGWSEYNGSKYLKEAQAALREAVKGSERAGELGLLK